jgi:catechol 2,3-dioxygenase-like lactoylglutathione lyase family enzyme
MARLRHIAIATKDPEKTAAFYQKVFGLQFVKRVPTSPRGGGVFLTDGHINFAFLNFPSDEAADMENGISYEGLHHLGFHVEDIDKTAKDLADTNAERLGEAAGTGHNFYFELKYRGPNRVIFDISSKGWDLAPPKPNTEPTQPAAKTTVVAAK